MTAKVKKQEDWESWARAYAEQKQNSLADGIDSLRYDSAKDDHLNTFDPLSRNASKIILPYDETLGFAASSDQKKSIYDFYTKNRAALSAQARSLADYQAKYEAAMSEADKKAKGVIGNIMDAGRKVGTQAKVRINITGNGRIESTHLVNKEWAEKTLPQFSSKTKGRYRPIKLKDGGWTIDAAGYGKELRNTISEVEKMTGQGDRKLDSAMKGVSSLLNATKGQVSSARRSAVEAHDFNLMKSQKTSEYIKSRWTGFIKSTRAAFTQGAKDNANGIRDLLDSGALTRKSA